MDLFEWAATQGSADKAVQLRHGLTVRLHSYVITRDYGFAPNPFFGYCTLATCKPAIRRVAEVGDWVVGTSSSSKGKTVQLVFAMQVGETMTFDQYWNDPRFRDKRPDLFGSKKRAFGDNIYHTVSGHWVQENSHHSLENGLCDLSNVRHDTKADRVLIGGWYVYHGRSGPPIPPKFRDYDGRDLHAGHGHKNDQFSKQMAADVIDWIKGLGAQGYCGKPLHWARTP